MQREKRRREEVERKRASKMSELYMEDTLGEEQPNTWAGKFRVGGRVCQVGTEGCWENLEARSALICKIYISIPCSRYEAKPI